MLEFGCALAAFIVSHRLPTTPSIRQWLVTRLGEKLYLSLYGLVSLGIVAWLISAAVRAPTIVIWHFQTWQAVVPLVLMPVAMVLFLASALSPNPLSVSLRPASGASELSAVVSITRHPILWAFALWALSHLIANGDLVAIILFGGLGLFAIAGMLILDRRTKRRLGADEWNRLADPTSILPFGAILAGRSRLKPDRHLIAGLIAGLAVYVWFLFQGHELVTGIDPLWWAMP